MAGGAYIRLKDGNIEIHAPGVIDQKAGSFPHAGPTSLFNQYALEPSSESGFIRKIIVKDELGKTMGHQWVEVIRQNGQIEKHLANADGELKIYTHDLMESLKINPYEPSE